MYIYIYIYICVRELLTKGACLPHLFSVSACLLSCVSFSPHPVFLRPHLRSSGRPDS